MIQNLGLEIDGQDIKNVNLFSLRKEISIVDQNVTLFDDTIFNNIKYAKPDAVDEEILKLLNNLCVWTLLKNLKTNIKQ